MNVSCRWIRDLAPGLDDSPRRMAERLAMYGAPVDDVVELGAGLQDIVVARVEHVRPHPDADRLSLCDVDPGTGDAVQVVCGAPNVRGGALYPFAPVGASLPGGVTIRKARIRGQYSHGMLCSERELGLGRDHAGILELHGDFRPGDSFTAALGLDDVRLVVDVTPNRSDLLSHWGIARELAAGGEAALRLPPFPGTAGNGSTAPAAALWDAAALRRAERQGGVGAAAVSIEDTRGCTRYLGAVVRGVSVAPSPEWLASRLRAVGLRPINNVVDATNYVHYELGQPLHAFDLARLDGPAVIVRRAAAGETLLTLDGQRRALQQDHLVIADGRAPIALAGVMGGEDSEVTAETRDVFLECALFDPRAVRRTRTAFGLATDASYRFERGVDPEGMERALRRTIALIAATAGGEVDPEIVDLHPVPRTAPVVHLRTSRVSRVLGIEFTAETLAGYLEPLGFRIVERSGDTLAVRVPGHRWADVEREVDLIEEVARRHGYEAFPAELRPLRPSTVPDGEMAPLEDRIRSFLVGRGFLEARTAAFAPEAEGDVALLLPLSAEESRLRRALIPGLTHRVEYNFAREIRHVRLFEIGTVFAPADSPADLPREATHLAAIFTGARTPPHWTVEPAAFDIWDLKALLAELGTLLLTGASAIEPVARAAGDHYAPGTRFRIVDESGAELGAGGQIAPHALDAPAWADPVWGLEIRLDPRMAAPARPVFAALPAYPGIARDLALLVPDNVSAAAAEAVIREAAGELLEDVRPFDVYRGREIPAGRRSIAFRLRFRSPERTLTDAEADVAVGRVLGRLNDELGIERRV